MAEKLKVTRNFIFEGQPVYTGDTLMVSDQKADNLLSLKNPPVEKIPPRALAKVKEARGMLRGIRNGELILYHEDDEELDKRTYSDSNLDGWPDDTTEDETDKDEGGGKIPFHILDEY